MIQFCLDFLKLFYLHNKISSILILSNFFPWLLHSFIEKYFCCPKTPKPNNFDSLRTVVLSTSGAKIHFVAIRGAAILRRDSSRLLPGLLEYDIFKHLKVIFPALSCETTTIKLDFEFHILLRGNFRILVRGGRAHLLDSKSYNGCFDMTQHD